MTITAPPSTRLALYRTYVEEITARCGADPGVRVALRKGLRRGLDDVGSLHRIVAPWLPEERGEAEERAFYAVAAMIADRPRHSFTAPADDETPEPGGQDSAAAVGNEPQTSAPTGEEAPPAEAGKAPARARRDSLGASFARAVTQGGQGGVRQDTAEARLNLLTRQSLEGLHRHLPGSVRLLRAGDTDIDFAVLLADLAAWPRYSKAISRRWLQDFYRLRNSALEAAARRRDSEDDETRDPN
ncbi:MULTISPECIES: type I-E CRISPR-associated protein Cse2/CasB [Streptomyces]|uniref:Type I-E CRISPR-associated protein Cse2/CasB n=1 Tax=Streptomyces doudnae TaxID=3075536 RepID=A0ABD5ENF5_9ACTN|nr:MULTISPECIES: type I-E CRISPR-associated protein Cse2/CasB [unclassified Streptomyces]MDT0436232.1 type I-E CRISPR-associated protein Cse2/CasB [Streptomyces sp. DSM 41981]SCE51253.1 CRISPR system Cascade subunit CasB [Streptomyces sp. SolWspMP-5a-2]